MPGQTAPLTTHVHALSCSYNLNSTLICHGQRYQARVRLRLSDHNIIMFGLQFEMVCALLTECCCCRHHSFHFWRPNMHVNVATACLARRLPAICKPLCCLLACKDRKNILNLQAGSDPTCTEARGRALPRPMALRATRSGEPTSPGSKLTWFCKH